MATTKKKTAKKTAKKKTASDPNFKAFPGMLAVLYNGEEVKQSDFFATRAKTLGIESDQARSIFRAHAAGQEEFDSSGDPKLDAAWKALGIDWKSHVKAKKAKSDAIEAAKAAAEESKKNASLAMKKAAEDMGDEGAIVTSLTSKIEGFVAQNLAEDGIIYAKGEFSLKKGTKVTDELIAHGFQKLSTFAAGGEQMRDSLAIAEAKFAIMVRDKFERSDWGNFFSDKPNDLSRLKKYMAVLERSKEIKIQDPDNMAETVSISEFLDRGEIPFSTARIALETRFSDNDAENKTERGNAISKIIETGRAQGGSVPQTQARNIIAELKGGEAKKQLKFFYVFILDDGSLKIAGSISQEPLLAATCALQIDRGRGQFLNNFQENAVLEDIVEPDDELKKWCGAQAREEGMEIEEKKAPAKKKKGKKAPKVEEEEEEPALIEEESDETPVEEWSNGDLGDAADDVENDSCEDAQAELTSRCEKGEIDPNEYETWADVAEALNAEPEEEGDSEEEEEEDDDSWG